MNFPYGNAPLAILILAIVSGGFLLALSGPPPGQRPPDLVYATFAPEHVDAYRLVLPRFEQMYGVKVQLELVDQKALQNRLQSALQVGAEVPDMVELMDGTMGYFTKGLIQDVDLIDLTDRVHQTGLYDSLVSSRFGKWSAGGRIFALPHDVHPVMLAYRRDLVEQLGIDVNKLTTWDEFCRVGREVVARTTGSDGVVQHYMLDLAADGSDALRMLLLQHGGKLFDGDGRVAFDGEASLDVVCWYVRQIQGPGRIAFPCGGRQTLAKAQIDGLCLFYFCPDWRTKQFENDVPELAGKMSLMPVPAWEPGGVRTTTWGGTGLAFTRPCRNVDLAWKLAMYLYYDLNQTGPRFAATNILPPLKAAWKQPQFDAPNLFYSGLHLGTAYAQLATQVPQEQSSPYLADARDRLSEVFSDATTYYSKHGEDGFQEYVRADLKRCADLVRQAMARNVFFADQAK
jgi:arabinosaccharide transport system substrate-binding protein